VAALPLALTPLVLAASPIPGPSSTGGGASLFADSLPCWRDPAQVGSLCRWVYDRTHTSWLAESSDWVIAKPAAILLIVVVAFVVRALLRRMINRIADRAAEGSVPGVLHRTRAVSLFESTGISWERRRQRADTMASVLNSLTTGIIFTVALFMVLAQLGLNIAPLIASAGILGVALGFGSQTLVKDFLSGMFMILEDQYGVGDVVDVGQASGTVEAVGLRVTRLRDVNGTVWYVPNGEVTRVGNMSQGWARAVLDVGIGYGEDIAHVSDLLQLTAHRLTEEEAWKDLILEEPEVWGVQELGHDAVVVRLVVKTAPLQQWAVSRELRQRIKAMLDEHGIEIPYPQRTVWVRTPGAPESDEARQDAHASVGTPESAVGEGAARNAATREGATRDGAPHEAGAGEGAEPDDRRGDPAEAAANPAGSDDR
jgi:small conductance mechanosensitive channel